MESLVLSDEQILTDFGKSDETGGFDPKGKHAVESPLHRGIGLVTAITGPKNGQA